MHMHTSVIVKVKNKLVRPCKEELPGQTGVSACAYLSSSNLCFTWRLLSYLLCLSSEVMIFVGGTPFPDHSSSSSSFQGKENLVALLEHPTLVSSSNLFKANPERKVSFSVLSAEESMPIKLVYIFQREYATIDPALVEFVGTDEATTCVGLVIRNQQTGMTSVAHLDSPKVVDLGLIQMLSSLVDQNPDAKLDVHIIGGFEDASPELNNGTSGSESHVESENYSFPLCSKIIEALWFRQEEFHIQTFFVLGHNTRKDLEGNAYPIFNGFLVETSTGSVFPASYDRSSRCPDEVVRRIRVIVAFGDPSWKGKLLETYDTRSDQFQIAACAWSPSWKHIALSMLQLSDSEMLLRCSTSPRAEGPDFIENERRILDYLIQHPDWRETFPARKPRVFRRTPDGGWIKS